MSQCQYHAVVQCLSDGHVFYQGFDYIDELIDFKELLGPDYIIIEII